MRNWRLILVGCLVFGLCAGFVQAQVVKNGHTTLDDLMAASPLLGVAQAVVPVEALRSEAAAMESPGMAAVVADWDRFITENGSQWQLQIDRRTGRPALIEGSGLPWIPGEGNRLSKSDLREVLAPGAEVKRGTLVRLAKDFIRQYKELFGVEVADLDVASGATGDYGGYLWYVQFNRTFQGIPVEKSYIVFRVNHGNLVQFGGEFLGPISVDTLPTISIETAQQILAGYVGGMSSKDGWLHDGALTILPMAPHGDAGSYAAMPGQGVDYRLVYTLTFRREGVMGTWTSKIDAHTGEVLFFGDENAYGSVTGGIFPNSPLDTEVVRPFPQVTVTNGTTKYTDAGGNYAFVTGTASAALTGKYVKVTDSCGTSSLSTSTAPGNLAWGSSTGTDCTTPGVGGAGNTHAARSTYYHITNWKMKAQAWLPSNTWLQAQLADKVNLNQTCNAYWDGSAVNFFKSGGGCANTGELPTVFLHEAAHGLDTNDGNGFSPDMGTGESYADTAAFLSTHDSCVGTGFFTDGSKCSGYGDACTTCTGIRDMDYAKHTSATAHTPLNFIKVRCPTSSNYKGPCGREGHCEGYIAGEAMWDLAARDLVSAGYSTATAWQITERLFYLTRPTAGAGFTCNASTFASDGCGTSHYFTVFRVADDDDGNLSNGTPHAAAIYAAFNRHAIGCSSVVNTNSTSCSALAQPTLTATAGSGQVALSWGAVTNASKYLVLRNEMSATAGFTIVAQPTTASYTDTAVATGITYYYSVQAVGSTQACFSALAAVKSATPTAGVTYSISGTVSGATASGVTMSLTGASTASTTTDTSGNYTFSGLANGSYTVTPSKSGYTFSPTSTAVTISGASQTGKNFTATAVVGTYSISGTVSGATASGVTMGLTGAATATTTTATDGTYGFSGLANGSYTVTPSKTGYTFSPTSTAVTISGANQTGKNFTATAVSGDTPLTSGVGVSSSVTLQAWKYYTIAVPSGATNLTVTLTGLSADIDLYANNSTTHPTTSTYYGRSWNSGTTNETLSWTTPTVATWCIGVYGYAAGNFTVTATVTTGTVTYSISGTVSGAVTSGVTMNLTGAATATTTTITGGTYTFSGLANGSYTVTPSLSGYTFSPTSLAVTISGANQTGKNFTATSTGGQVTLFTNGFDATTGWAQVDTSGTAGTWSQVTSGTYPTCSRHGGTYMAKFNSYTAASGNATRYYRTSGFAVSSTYTTVTWTFWMYHDTGYSTYADKVQPQVSTNGSTWTAVGTAINRYDGSTGWKQHTVNISTYKGSTVYLGFLGTSAYGNNIYLDDALVVAQ
jgi:hypothetical protein